MDGEAAVVSINAQAIVNLPIKPTPPTEINPRALLLYGLPLTGKSRFCAQLPEPYIIADLDGHCAYHECCHSPHLKTYLEIFEFIIAVRKAGKPYKYIVLDSLSRLEEAAAVSATKIYNDNLKEGAQPVRDLRQAGAGRGYNDLYSEIQNVVTAFLDLAPYVIFIGHTRDKWDQEKSMQMDYTLKKGVVKDILAEPTEKILDLPGKYAKNFLSQMHAVGYFRKGGEIIFEGTVDMYASRVKHLDGVTIKADWSKIYI